MNRKKLIRRIIQFSDPDLFVFQESDLVDLDDRSIKNIYDSLLIDLAIKTAYRNRRKAV